MLIDVSRTKKQREKFYNVVKNFSKNCFVPITVGGMIDSVDEIRLFQSFGVDKIFSQFITVKKRKIIKKSN